MSEWPKYRPPLTREVGGVTELFSEAQVFFEDGSSYNISTAIKRGMVCRDEVPVLQSQTLHNYAIGVMHAFIKNNRNGTNGSNGGSGV